jgi:hypothetical protein
VKMCLCCRRVKNQWCSKDYCTSREFSPGVA